VTACLGFAAGQRLRRCFMCSLFSCSVVPIHFCICYCSTGSGPLHMQLTPPTPVRRCHEYTNEPSHADAPLLVV